MIGIDELVALGIVGAVVAWLIYARADARAEDGLAGAAAFTAVTVMTLVGVWLLALVGALWGYWFWQWLAGSVGVVMAAALWALWKELR